ncbi:membrane protein insertion efficiency factor YidD [Cellulomonas xiejunii]|uniref:Putative membrane protein insertion efficiency factor n=1 Tax=Cellulomonas xiejunii TaxID=2968083 RepID=A0ABY5KN32_9CELL|nr:membrane protein insertion efficiency factor YidD [Cellulomonas xiejunii]MCC2313514.1 membrane protein insertion efficiency factor YidD [Cellulomonas xiejunii]MCC2321312.1 membrane protein insertion efficiency factor YidD [Cellulomonas xiejunii]UUI71899.1 membrane protein insertion efficiency factor YidD [Cellulomonas xiejunii]
MTWSTLWGTVRRVPTSVLLGLLWVYQRVVSPLTPATCRFYPSCSQYAVIAVRRHGALRGVWLAVRRLARCHPWNPGGVDDVPPARSTHHSHDAATAAH